MLVCNLSVIVTCEVNDLEEFVTICLYRLSTACHYWMLPLGRTRFREKILSRASDRLTWNFARMQRATIRNMGLTIYMKNFRLPDRFVNRSRFTAQDFLSGRNANGTVKEAPIFAEWILKICRVRYYELSPSACVQNFVHVRHSRDLKLFSEISLAPVEAFNNLSLIHIWRCRRRG